jgi:hypothetical protein
MAMKRPQKHDENVRHLAATMLVERLKSSHPDIFDDCTDEDVHRDLLEALTDDGYQMARNLERQHWEVDASLVDELNGGCLDAAYDSLVEKWIGWHAIKPKLTIGATVRVHPGIWAKTGPADGEIASIDMKRGTYTVCVPAWGHVKAGLGTHGRIFSWEEVEAWQATASAA